MTSALGQDLINFFFEALFKHLIGLIQNDCLQRREVDIATLNVIKDTTASADEEVYALSKCSGLVFDVDTTVDCQ